MKTVLPILATLEERFIALLFGNGNMNVALHEARMLGHVCQLTKDLMSTSLAQEWLGEITVTKTGATHCQCLTEGIVAMLQMVNGVTMQVGCQFTLIVIGNHGV